MSIEDLNAEVERLKARKLAEGKALELEQLETAIGDNAGIVGAGDVAKDVMTIMERVMLRSRERAEALRPEFDALPETADCPEHPTVARKKLFEETCQRSHHNGYFTPVYAPCVECDGEREKTKRRRFWSRRGVPERLIDSTLSTFQCETDDQRATLDKVKQWIQRNGVFLLLSGTPGTGKGHLATGCLKAQGDGRFITHPDMLSDLRASYTLHNTPEVIEVWRECEMFVLDEFGVSPGGRDEEPLLYQVLADRYDKRRPTIITSNMELPALKEAIGFRLFDRISEDCCAIVMRWNSHRSKK